MSAAADDIPPASLPLDRDTNGSGERELPPATALFRAQAVEGLRSRHGRPVPLFGIASWVVVAFIVALLVAVLATLFLSSFARKETVEGFLQPQSGSATITFPRPGRVTDIYVREGQMVRKGQRLMKISLDTALEGETLGSRLARANDTQAAELRQQMVAERWSDSARQEEAASRFAGAQTQIGHLTKAASLQRERLSLAQETLAGLETLLARGFVSKMRLREKEAEVIMIRQAISDTERQIDQARADMATLRATSGQARADTARTVAQLRSNKAQLEQQRAQSDAERDVILVAPYAGRLVTVRAVIGSALDANTPLATVLPQGDKLEAVLWVPSRAIGFVTPGDQVRLMFDAFPYQRFGTGHGTVRAISTTPVDARELPSRTLADEGVVYRVKVQLEAQAIDAYGKSWVLAPGSRLRADLILDRQSLLDWVLDPLQAFRKRST
ncbi:HlyD family secretion protein [Sphingomonas sp. HT-1]|uniref:HlyD family secretion protein n=1 Tax=Sphingomonas sp. HT-1 TaxID=3400348 RepID=UPI0002F20A01